MNSIKRLHNEAMRIADVALAARWKGDIEAFARLARQALGFESRAAYLAWREQVPDPDSAILHRSAAALAIDIGRFDLAAKLVYRALSASLEAYPDVLKELTKLRDAATIRLRIFSSPEKARLLGDLCHTFSSRLAPDEETGKVFYADVHSGVSSDFLDAAKDGRADVLAPDSTLLLADLQQANVRVEDTFVGWASSPLVLVLPPSLARREGHMDAPETEKVLRDALHNPQFRWAHAHESAASGLLALVGQASCLSDKPLSVALQDEQFQTRLRLLDARLSRRAPDDMQLLERFFKGRGREPEAVVLQEAVLRRHPDHSGLDVLRFPGTGVWFDHPLILLRSEDPQKRAFNQLKEFLGSDEALAAIDDAGMGFDENAHESEKLVSLAPALAAAARSYRRAIAVSLLVDVSDSMNGDKLEAAKLAFSAFVGFLSEERGDVLALTGFSSQVDPVIPLSELSKSDAQHAVSALSCGGQTALVDAVVSALPEIRGLSPERFSRAVLLLTDGRENASSAEALAALDVTLVPSKPSESVPVFALAYGSDADFTLLSRLAAETGGEAKKGTVESLQGVLRQIEKYL